MNLIGIIPNRNNYNICYPLKSPLSEINTANPIFIEHEHMDGTKEATFHVNLIYLLDRLFLHDYYSALSIEQERFIKRFLYEAGIVTDKKSYDNMSDIMKQLDNFLGSYTGENNGRFTR